MTIAIMTSTSSNLRASDISRWYMLSCGSSDDSSESVFQNLVCKLSGIRVHLFKNVLSWLKDSAHFMIAPHTSRVMVFWSEPGFKTFRSGGGKSVGNICRLCIRDEMHQMMGFTYLSYGCSTLVLWGEVEITSGTANHWNLVVVAMWHDQLVCAQAHRYIRRGNLAHFLTSPLLGNSL